MFRANINIYTYNNTIIGMLFILNNIFSKTNLQETQRVTKM